MKHNIYQRLSAIMFSLILAVSNAYSFNHYNKGDSTITKTSVQINRNKIKAKNESLNPVEYLYFEAIKSESKVRIYWDVKNTNNIDYFVIERSQNNKHFVKVAKIDAANCTESIINFQETDNFPCDGISYYRLKQVSNDNTCSYSNVFMVNYHFKKDNNLVYPNTCKDENLSFLTLKNKEVLLVLKNKIGEDVYSKVSVSTQNSDITGTINDDQIEPGDYIITGSSDNMLYGRMIKIK